MPDDVPTINIELSPNLTCQIIRPIAGGDVCYATIGGSPEFNNEFLDSFIETHRSKFANHNVAVIATSSSPWTLLQFPESQEAEIISLLKISTI